MIQKSKKIIATGLLSALTAAYLFGGFAQAKEEETSNAKEKLEAYIKFTQILNVIEKEYVDEVNTTTLVDKALKGLMANLDAHSTFMDTKSYKDLTVQTKGEFGGLGISVGMKEGALTVIAPLEGTPAMKAGVKAGDIILKIDDKATLGMNIDEAVKLMRGKPGTDIVLTIIRKKEPKPLKIKITRDIIKIDSVYPKTIKVRTGYSICISPLSTKRLLRVSRKPSPITTTQKGSSSTCVTTPAVCSIRRRDWWICSSITG